MPVIETVRAPIEASSVGLVLAAETILCAPAERRGNAGVPAGDAEFERSHVDMPALGRLMLGAVNTDDRTLTAPDAEGALDVLAAAVGEGPVPLIVALAGHGSTARPGALACLSRASGVAIVRGIDGTGGGEAGARGHADQDLDSAPDPDAAAAIISAELSAAEHPAGVVGAIPLPDAAAPAEQQDRARALIRSAAAAARAAGVALVLAPAADPWAVAPAPTDVRERFADLAPALADVDAAGLDRSRVILTGTAGLIASERGHGVDLESLDALLDLGPAICFDDLGRIPNVRTVVSDHDIAIAILRAAERGTASRIVLSSGIRNKHRLTAFGGNGLEFAATQFLPYLRMLGADDALVSAVGGGNAARMLARTTHEGAAQ
ncbi:MULTISPECIES: hypothetical protein [unclassified Leucobacter]|uniref:phosphotriesterase family protein n=1 Tax=unclassified Leucobacter TaxID=2621730 RepID=UPI003016A29C